MDSTGILRLYQQNHLTKGLLMMEENGQIVTLVDEDGFEQEFEVVFTLEMDQNEYAVLIPIVEQDDAEDEELEAEAYIFRMEKDPLDEELVLVAVEDDDEFDRVAALYESEVDEIDSQIH